MLQLIPPPPPRPPVPPATEAEFCAAVLRERERNFAVLVIVVGVAFHLLSILLDPFVAHGHARLVLLGDHLASLALVAAYNLVPRASPWRVKLGVPLIFAGFVVTMSGYAWIFFEDTWQNLSLAVMRAWTGYYALGTFMLLMIPLHDMRAPLAFAAALSAVQAVAWLPFPNGVPLGFVGATALFFAAAFRCAMIRRSRREARLEYVAAIAKASESRAVYEQELSLARRFQDSFVPEHEARIGRYLVRGVVSRSDTVGGDWFAVRQEEGGRGLVLVADAAGKGLHAALVIHGIQSLWAAVPETDRLDVPAWLGSLNATLLAMSQRAPHHASVAILELGADAVRYWSAGNVPAFVVRHVAAERRERPRQILGRGPILGVAPEVRFEPAVVPLPTGRPAGEFGVLIGTDGAFPTGARGPRHVAALDAAMKRGEPGVLAKVPGTDDKLLIRISRAA